jgi:hypothetical protein
LAAIGPLAADGTCLSGVYLLSAQIKNLERIDAKNGYSLFRKKLFDFSAKNRLQLFDFAYLVRGLFHPSESCSRQQDCGRDR